MADILIQMEIPKTCGECRFCRPKPPYPCNCYAGDFLIKPSETDMRDGLCPLRELPEHGDLIDRDEYIAMMESNCDKSTTLDSYIFHVCRGGVKTMPVIVPSNKEETK